MAKGREWAVQIIGTNLVIYTRPDAKGSWRINDKFTYDSVAKAKAKQKEKLEDLRAMYPEEKVRMTTPLAVF